MNYSNFGYCFNLLRFCEKVEKSMKILGIKFVPWNAPLRERLEIFGAAAFFLHMSLIVLGPYLIFYVIVNTQYWTIAVAYLIWLYVIDADTPEQGGRRSEWVCSWWLWKYARDYFPVKLIKLDGTELDPKRNYTFAIFPHGLFASGGFIAFGSNACNFSDLFPYHKSNIVTVHTLFKIPIHRDVIMSWGHVPSSAKSINYLLRNPVGGNVAALFVGGVSEALNAHPGSYNLVVKKRRGFIKLSLKNGSPIVPVFSFGENNVYTQVSNPKGSYMRRFQEWLKDKTYFTAVIFNGRGFFQENFGLIPKRAPINIVVGKPIEVAKVENPTEDEIDALHSKFTKELINLFEENKHKYEENPEKVKLVIT